MSDTELLKISMENTGLLQEEKTGQKIDINELRTLAIDAFRMDLIGKEGFFLASGKEEIYGCFFGRDTATMVLLILDAYRKNPEKVPPDLMEVCKKSLLTHIVLQGKADNIERGEEKGKFIHEYRTENYEHLTNPQRPGMKPWFFDPQENSLKNYDSVDSTPLTLWAIYEYYSLTKDRDFLLHVLPSIEKGLDWIINNQITLGKGFVAFEFNKERKFGGLPVQSWTDSDESFRQADGTMPPYPIAPVEVQGYAWLALKLWSRFFGEDLYGRGNKEYAKKLASQADKLKEDFNKKFIFRDEDSRFFYLAQGLDGNGQEIKTITANPLLCLRASYENEAGRSECIIDEEYLDDIVKRAFMPDLFDEGAGIRTMSLKSATYKMNSYHNGTWWPFQNGLIYGGLKKFKYEDMAEKVKNATFLGIYGMNKNLVELFDKDEAGNYRDYKNEYGQVGCQTQGWTAAAILNLTT